MLPQCVCWQVLEAAHVACHIIAAVQSHFRKVIVPAVAPSVSDHSAATSALVALIKAVEESVMVTLRKCVDAFMVQVTDQAACSGTAQCVTYMLCAGWRGVTSVPATACTASACTASACTASACTDKCV